MKVKDSVRRRRCLRHSTFIASAIGLLTLALPGQSSVLLSENKDDAHSKILTDGSGRSLIATLEAAITTNSNLTLILRWRRMSHPIEKIAPERRQPSGKSLHPSGHEEAPGRPMARGRFEAESG